jgi:hypothetical protein
MLRQEQSDALMAYLEAKVDSVKREIEDAEASYAEAPNRNEWTDFCHCDVMHELNGKLNFWERKLEDAELLEIESPALPTITSRIRAASASVLGILLGMVVGIELAIAFIYQNNDLAGTTPCRSGNRFGG